MAVPPPSLLAILLLVRGAQSCAEEFAEDTLRRMVYCWNKEQGCVPCEDMPCSRTTCGGGSMWSADCDAYCTFLPGCASN